MPQVRKTAKERSLTGSRPFKRANSSEMVTVEGKLPIDPPTGLTKEARAAWMMAVQCAPRGILTALDHSVLERWARNYALYRKLAKAVDQSGAVVDGDPSRVSGSFNALIKVQQVLAACEKELGFTPASRTRVNARSDDGEDSANAFEGL